MVKLFFILRSLIIKRKLRFLHPIYRLIGLMYSSSIPINCTIRKQPIFMHGMYGIFISGAAKIGENVVLYQHVTIGWHWDKNSKNFGAPEIGDNTVLFPGCKVIGGVKVGKNCKIGPNVVVWEDVPDNTTIVFEKNSFRSLTNKC